MSSTTATLVEVQVRTTGGALLADAAVGALVLSVDFPVDFDEDGGTLSLDDVTYAYVAADAEADTVTLAEPLDVAVARPEFVTALDATGAAGAVWTAVVDTGDDEGDDDEADIPTGLQPFFRPGVADAGARVALSWTGEEYEVASRPGQEPVFDGSLIDPGTVDFGALDPATVPEIVPAAPLVSPVPTVLAGPAAAVVTWDPVEGEVYDVHVASTDAALPSAATLHPEATGTLPAAWVRTFPDATALPVDADSWFALVAKNAGGTAPVSVWVNGRPGVVPPEFVSLVVGQLLANGVLAEAVSAVDLHVSGDFESNTQTAYGQVSYRSPDNEYGPGSGFTLQKSTTAPASPPSVTQGVHTVAVGTWLKIHGGVWYDGAIWTVTAWHTPDSRLWRMDAVTGEATSLFTVSAIDYPATSVTRIGLSWYVATKYQYDDDVTVLVFDDAGTQIGSAWVIDTLARTGAIGTDGTDLIKARTGPNGNGLLVFDHYNPATRALLKTVVTSVNDIGFVNSVEFGSFDLGSPHYVVVANRTGDAALVFNATGTQVTANQWPVAGGLTHGAPVVWDGANFWHAGELKLCRYETDVATTKRWASNTWTDGTYETTQGPRASYTPKKRWRATLTLPAIPSGSTSRRVYLGQGATDPGRTAMWRQADTATNPLAITDPVFSGTNPPAVTDYPGDGVPAFIRSSDGTTMIDADGVNANPKEKQAGVTATGAFPAINTNVTVHVTFAVAFDAPPSVQLSAELDFPERMSGLCVYLVTATGFDLIARRSNGTSSVGVHWTANRRTQ